MRVALILVMVALATVSGQGAPNQTRLQGDFMLFGGVLGESSPPTGTDAKVSFHITGRLAAEMYDRLGAKAQHDECTNSSVRTLRDVVCYRSGRVNDCYFGLDLKTGKTTNGVIC
jgi:hypothetical protein